MLPGHTIRPADDYDSYRFLRQSRRGADYGCALTIYKRRKLNRPLLWASLTLVIATLYLYI